MKRTIKTAIALIGALAAGCTILSACGNAGSDKGYMSGSYYPNYYPEFNLGAPDASDIGGGFVHESVIESKFQTVAENPSSYFSLDRNTACYSMIRSQIESGYTVDGDGVRIEEMINYFDYDFAAPTDKAVAVSTAYSACPWNEENKLMLVGLKTSEIVSSSNANYVFLVDVSGSMSGDDRIGLAKKGFKYMLNELGDNDLVSIVTYASGVKTVLDGGECSKSGKEKILNTLSSLTAGGSTNGSGGLQRAYDIAKKHFITGGNNRVIIITDGDFNVGISNQTELKEFIQDKAQAGTYLSVIGVGMGNTRDDFLETLATCGNGNYAYLDGENEARKVFVDELKSNLYTVAKDAKAGVTFTSSVQKYRLIGYDTKRISQDDFNNIKADTGEIGSNLCVAALYEITLAENADGKIADVEIRYKDVRGEGEINESVTASVDMQTQSNDDMAFISCVAEFGLILRASSYKGNASLSAVVERLNDLSAYIANDVYKKEFVNLVGKATEIVAYK